MTAAWRSNSIEVIKKLLNLNFRSRVTFLSIIACIAERLWVMRSFEVIHNLFNQYHVKYPHSSININILRSRTHEDRREFARFIDFARDAQTRQPLYEMAYQRLVHLYVLGGSRIDLLDALDRRLWAAIAGQSALILIEGVSGIGKTSLAMVQELHAQELGAVFVMGRCYDHGATPFWIWQDVIQSIGKLNDTSLDTLPSPFGKGTSVHSIQHLTQALGQWLISCADAQPLVILLDDLHWADSDSLEVLNQLVGTLRQQRILFIATYRSEETHRDRPLYHHLPLLHRNDNVDTLQLTPLTKEDTSRLVTAFHGECHPWLGDYLFQRAEGHLLFTVELLRDLVDRNLLKQDDKGLWLPPDQSVPVPTLLKNVIMQRVARLGEIGEIILSQAAIVGETWQLALVESLTVFSEDDLLNVLEQALRADLITMIDERQEIYRFSHGLIREVLYRQHIPRRRKRLHERIGVYLEAQTQVNLAQLSHHFYEAEDWKKSFEYSSKAGQEAARNYANNHAIELYQKALESIHHIPNDVDSHLHIEIYLLIGDAYRVLDQNVQAEAIYSRMRDIARITGDHYAEGVALSRLVYTRIAQYQLDLTEQTAHEALKVAEKLGEPRLLAQAYGSLAKLLVVRGQLDAAAYYIDQYGHHSEALNDATVQSDVLRQKAYLAVWESRYSEAETIAHQCLEQGLKTGNLLSITGGYQILSIALIEAGKYTEAYQGLHSIVNQTTLNDPYHHQLPRLLNHMGYLFLELGDASQALTWDKQAWEVSHNDKGVSRYEIQRYCLMNIATDLIYLDRMDEAAEYVARFDMLKAAPDLAQFRYQNRYLLLRSELHLVQRQFTQAIEFAHEARTVAQQFRATKNIAKSHWLEGQALLEIRQLQSAVDHLQRALTLVNTIQHGSLRWKIGLSLAKALIQIGEMPDEVIQTAQTFIDKTRLTLANSPLRESFKPEYWLNALAENQTPEKPVYPTGLTPREVEILRLVASGATNQQIADTLVISPRTVNTHITNILNKTGCDNRTAASAFAIKHNLLTT